MNAASARARTAAARITSAIRRGSLLTVSRAVIASFTDELPYSKHNMVAETGGGGAETPTGVRVLVVDDDERICRQMAAGLANAGYQVVTAHDGMRGIEQAAETPPDIAIVDLEMDGTSGIDVIRALKKQSGP